MARYQRAVYDKIWTVLKHAKEVLRGRGVVRLKSENRLIYIYTPFPRLP